MFGTVLQTVHTDWDDPELHQSVVQHIVNEGHLHAAVAIAPALQKCAAAQDLACVYLLCRHLQVRSLNMTLQLGLTVTVNSELADA